MSAPNAIRTSANGKALVTDFGEWETDVRYIRADETDRLIAEAVAAERGVWVEAAIRMMPEAKYLDLMIVAAELREARALIAKDGGE